MGASSTVIVAAPDQKLWIRQIRCPLISQFEVAIIISAEKFSRGVINYTSDDAGWTEGESDGGMSAFFCRRERKQQLSQQPAAIRGHNLRVYQPEALARN